MAEDISEIREKKKEQIKERMQSQQGEGELKERREQEMQKAEAMKKHLLRKALTTEARERLGRIKAAKPRKAKKLEKLVIQLWKSGKIQGKITDEKLKKILKRLSSNKKEMNIKRK